LYINKNIKLLAQGYFCLFINLTNFSLSYFSSLSFIPNNTLNLLYFSSLSLFSYSFSPLSLFSISSCNQTHPKWIKEKFKKLHFTKLIMQKRSNHTHQCIHICLYCSFHVPSHPSLFASVSTHHRVHIKLLYRSETKKRNNQ